ncbi:hypothetical protein COCMIDRAFT_98274, partial [Bipolaris oryzae ATCC 44560]
IKSPISPCFPASSSYLQSGAHNYQLSFPSALCCFFHSLPSRVDIHSFLVLTS